MTAEEPRVKLKRLFLLFGIVNGGIVALALLAMLFITFLPTHSASAWHLRHGSTFVLEGHSFHVPLTWDCHLTHYREWELSNDSPLSRGESSIILSSTGKIADLTTINRSIANQMESLKKVPTLLSPSMEIIHAKQLKFICMHIDNRQSGEILFCQVLDIDISVVMFAAPGHRSETRAILETSN